MCQNFTMVLVHLVVRILNYRKEKLQYKWMHVVMSYTLHVQVCIMISFRMCLIKEHSTLQISKSGILEWRLFSVHYRHIVNMLVTKMRVYYFKLEAFHIKYILYAQKKVKNGMKIWKWNTYAYFRYDAHHYNGDAQWVMFVTLLSQLFCYKNIFYRI